MHRILVVEDNELNRDMLSRRLGRRGFEVLLAVDGTQGLELARSQSPDVILMDMRLPDMDGWDATRVLKARDETRQIPVIALTAHAMAGDRDRYLGAGFNDYVTKPITDEELLLGAIRRHVAF